MTRDKELWALAAWVEKTHGDGGSAFIGQQVTRLAQVGDAGGIALWRAVADRFDKLREPTVLQ